MRFVYGKQDWATMGRGQENCYLLTNGLGGFSSGTMIGSSARSEHALLMACVEPPDRRLNMVHRLEERLVFPGETIHLSSQEYVSGRRKEEGYRFLSSFCFEDYPKWVFHASGVEVVKRAAMKQGKNLVAVKYEIDNRTDGKVALEVTPYLQFAPKGAGVGSGQEFVLGADRIASNGHTLYFHTDGEVQGFAQQFVEGLFYAYDACDGRAREGNAHINHRIIKEVPGHGCATLGILYSMEKRDWEGQEGSEAWKDQEGRERETECETWKGTASGIADKVIQEAVSYRNELVRICGMRHQAARMLVKSAGQFVAERKSTGGKTILAGFPFFGDWGRDTMVALAGCCITAGQLGTAKSILRTFAAYCKDGLMPNLFPEGLAQPQYNTADASLLYINAVYLYFKKTQDIPFLKEVWHVMEEIIKYYREGTAYGIHMDRDGMLLAGEGLSQVTWMDVRIGEILPTPRHGKPVEINAYWYNALCIMDGFGKLLKAETDYAYMAGVAKESFREKFWNREKGCLKDLVSGTDADGQVRCNQIWAVSLPFTMLDAEQEKQVVDTVFEKLYTPYGLRTLEKSDREFRGWYGGEQTERDLAYHQGTVWVFPLGAYYLAYLKTRGYSKKALETVSGQLEVLESAMAEGCIGQLPEIYDGENPSFSRGCFAQAWSVGEILRVYEALEEHKM